MQRVAVDRIAVIGTVMVLECFAFIHRYALSSLIGASTLLQDLNMTASQAGSLGAMAFGAYGAMQIPSGILTDRVDARRLLSAGTATVVVSLLLFAAAPSYPVALLARLLLGCGLGLFFVPVTKLCSTWVGTRLYGTLIGATVAWTTLTALVTFLIIPAPLAQLGWRWTMVLLAAPLAPFVLLVYRLADGPEESPYASTAERRPISFAALAAEWWAIFRYREVWMLTIAMLVWEGQNLALLTWLPRYTVEALGQSRDASGILASFNLLGVMGGAFSGGFLSGRFPGRAQLLFFGGAVVYTALLATLIAVYPIAGAVPSLLPAISLLLGLTMGQFTTGYVPIARAVPRHLVGTANGIYGAGAFLGGAIFPWLVGLVMDAVDRPTVAGAVYSAAAYNTGFGVGAAILAVTLIAVVALGRVAPAAPPLGKASAS